MSKHPDVLIGTTDAGGGSIEVLVTGVEVRLAVRDKQTEVVLFLGPDEVINVRDMLDRALDV